jgi:arylsulfatase A-like enzyme
MRRLPPTALPLRAALLAIALLGAAVTAALALGTSEAPAQAERAQTARPNVIQIVTDDQTVRDLEVMSATKRLIADEGTTFGNSFVNFSMCCPSRATLLSGQYAHNHDVMGIYPPTGGYGKFDSNNSLALWLQRGGYQTGHIGKMLNGYGSDSPANIPNGWSEWYASVDPSTYRMYGYTLNENGVFRTYGDPKEENPAVYQTDVYTDKAVDYVNRNSGRPFYLSLNYLAPHHEEAPVRDQTSVIVRPAKRHINALSSKAVPRGPAFDEPDLSDKPPHVARRSTAPFTEEQVQEISRNYQRRQESLLAVDEGVERIVETLRANGQLANTYIMFTSDNGYLQGQHRIPSGKIAPYEPSIRVPLLIRGPGVPRGRTSREMVVNADLAPTLVDVTGVKPFKVQDGRSLQRFWKRPRLKTTRPIMLQSGGVNRGFEEQDAGPVAILRPLQTYKGIRTDRYLYVAYRSNTKEMYDLARDPFQLDSVIDDPRYRAARRELRSQLTALKRCRGRSCRLQRPEVPGPGPKVDSFLGIDPVTVSPRRTRSGQRAGAR